MEFLANGSEDKSTKIWNLQTKTEEFSLLGHGDEIWSVCFSPDNLYLASGSEDNTLKLWNIETRNEIFTYTGHQSDVYCVCFSPNGKYIASASRDKTVIGWDVEGKKEICPLAEHDYLVHSVSFSPDNQSLASASSDSSIIIWNIEDKREDITSPNIVLTNLKFSILHFFALIGQTDQISYLTKAKHAILMQDAFGHSPLYYSIKTKHQGITDLLLEYLCKIINSPIKDISSYISLESISNNIGLIISNSSEILDSFFGDVLLKTIKEPLPACYLS